MSIHLNNKVNILTAFIQNRVDKYLNGLGFLNEQNSQRLAESEIRIGSDKQEFSTALTKHSNAIYEGGF